QPLARVLARSGGALPALARRARLLPRRGPAAQGHPARPAGRVNPSGPAALGWPGPQAGAVPMRHRTRTVLSATLAALLLAACQREPAAPAVSDTAATPPAPANPHCPADPGTAPRGELAATRIAAADADGSRGLYEGPVWTGEALYFSHFTFDPGIPSRILRLAADGRVETV